MDQTCNMGFLDVLEYVPPLLDACTLDSTTALRTLRLVSREASRIALTAFRSYTVTLQGNAQDTNMSGIKLLQRTRLEKLTVVLHLTDSFIPSNLLKDFVRQAKHSLGSVAHLEISLEDTSARTLHTFVDRNFIILFGYIPTEIDQALVLLARTCPALTTLTYSGKLSPQFLLNLNDGCPRLRSVTLNADDKGIEFNLFVELPALLPRIVSLALPNISLTSLHHLSEIECLTSLDISSHDFDSERHWEGLPKQIIFLKCKDIHAGPPASFSDKGHFNRLTHIESTTPEMPLGVLAQVLRAAPVLLHIQDRSCVNADSVGMVISIDLNWTAIADLELLQQRIETGLQLDACYNFSTGRVREEGLSMLSLTDSLPCMKHATRCSLNDFLPSELGSFLKAFPRIQHLTLKSAQCMDDVELQDVAACRNLRNLDLFRCDNVSPMGLMALCQVLPKLLRIKCVSCTLMTKPRLSQCVQLLDRQGLQVSMMIA